MEKKYFSLVTDKGLEEIMKAINEGGKLKIKEFAVGDGNGEYYIPEQDAIGLRREVWRGEINACRISKDNENLLVVESVVPSDVGGFTIREMAIYDDAGNMIALCNTPDTQKVNTSDGVLHELSLAMEIVLSNEDVIQLTVDPTVNATKNDLKILREDVENSIREAKEVLSRIDELIGTNDIADIGAGNITGIIYEINRSRGEAGGIAELDENGKIPAAQLPSYVDDVQEGYLYNGGFYQEEDHTGLITAESGKIYIDISSGKTYRWSGSQYVVISETLAMGETASTAYRGDRGKAAYDHSQSAHLSLGETASTAYAGSKGKALADSMGALSGLTTAAKTTLVAAINELNAGLKNAVPAGLRSGYVLTGLKDGTEASRGSTAEGFGNEISSGWNSHAEGQLNKVTGSCAHGEGSDNIVSGNFAHGNGKNVIASAYAQTSIGYYNVQYGSNINEINSYFIIGNGSKDARSNAFRVNWDGTCYGKGAYQTSGADYAEFFEWLDGNPNAEDRRGYFVTLDGKKVKLASPGDYILGIVSAAPVVVGNADPDNWHGRFLRDDFGRYIMQTVTERIQTGEDDFEEVKRETYILNPDFDESKDQEYVPRSERPEWSPVGMLGQLIVRDDGSCQVNGSCRVAADGIATASDTGWRVIERVRHDLVKIIFK